MENFFGFFCFDYGLWKMNVKVKGKIALSFFLWIMVKNSLKLTIQTEKIKSNA